MQNNLIISSYCQNEYEFGGYQRELALRVPDIGLDIIDINLILSSGPNQDGGSVNDLHLLWDNSDITTYVISALKSALQQIPNSDLEIGYRTGIQLWWAFANASGDYGDTTGQIVKNALTQNAVDIIAGINKLGDSADSCRGNLHPLNYFYKQIPLSPISLAQVIKQWNGDHPALPPLVLGPGSFLRISYGVPTTDPHWVPNPAQGRVSSALLIAVSNPLTAISNSIDDISTVVAEIYNNVMLNGPIYSRITDLTSNLDGINQRLSDCAANIGSPADITTIGNTLADIKRVLKMTDS